MRETELRPAVINWLKQQEYDYAREILLGGYCDIVCYKFAEKISRRIPELLEVVAIELKLENVAGVLRQALGNQHHVNASWVAMPDERVKRIKPEVMERFRDSGIGILAVISPVEAQIVIPALRATDERHNKGTLKSRLWRRKREGIVYD